MRLDKEDQTTKTPIQSPLLDLVVAPHLEQISHENKTAHSVSESHSPSRDDYFAIVARAWNVSSGTSRQPLRATTSVSGKRIFTPLIALVSLPRFATRLPVRPTTGAA